MRLRPFLSAGVALLISSILLPSCGGVPLALTQLQKQRYDKASKQLLRAVAKDSLPVGAYYGYSLLYSDSGYVSYNIDSAYHYVQQARASYPKLSDKQQGKLLRRLDVDSTRLLTQKLRVDSLAYARAVAQDSLPDYHYFINNFATAPQVPTATARRNELAYDSVQQVDTYAAYKYFMDTYPAAAQYPQAQARYNTLAFQEVTDEGDLTSYLRFLEAYPNSPYRPQAERAVYEISTADGRLTSYARFARQYPRSTPARAAVNTLYHLYRSAYSPLSFLQDFPGLPFADSLRLAIRTESRSLSPTLNDAGFGFIDLQGAVLSDASYDHIPASYRCQGVLTNFVHAAQQQSQQLQHHLLSKAGQPIFSFSEALPADSAEVFLDESVVDREAGLIVITNNNRLQLIHQGGHVLITPEEGVADVELVSASESASEPWPVPYQFIKFRTNGQWGLKTFTGRTLLKPDYAAIDAYGPFVVLERDGRLAVTSRDQIVESVAPPPPLRFRYDDVAPLGSDFLLVYQGDQEGVLDQQLSEVVPLASHQVVRHFRGDTTAYWLLKHMDTLQQVVADTLQTHTQTTYSLYDPTTPATNTPKYERAFYNERWLALQQLKQFWLLDSGLPEAFDSVQILGSQFVLTVPLESSGSDSVTVRLTNGHRRRFARAGDGQIPTLRLLRTKGIALADQRREFLWVAPTGEPPMIINEQGQTILSRPLTGATVHPQGLIATEQGRKQGLVDSLGQELLPPEYAGIGNYEAPGILSLFDKKKFGLFLYPAGITLEPTYESALTRYSAADSAARWRFVAKNNGKYGIVTATNERLTPFAFERVIYWNDTSALVKADGRWLIYRLTPTTTQWSSLNPDHVLYDNIDDFSFFQQGNDQPEQLLRIYTHSGYGLLSSRRGEVLAPTYDGIIRFGDPAADDYLYLTEKYVPEADLYVMIYLNAAGELVRRQALTAEQYDRLYCQ
jgi:hypothetical protein